jgi:tetratricopeptide (TPR) repeat protein
MNDTADAGGISADEAREEKDALEALDLARGDLTDDDLATLEAAIDQIDFASRRATPERLERLKAMGVRLADVVEQIGQGVRKRSEAHTLTPDEEKRYEELVSAGVAHAEKGELDKAREKLEAAVTLDPDEPSGLFNLGVLYGKLMEVAATKGDFYSSHVPDEVFAEKAAFCFERVIELDPKSAVALTNLAALYDIRGREDMARESLKRALEIDPNEAKAREHLLDLDSRGT